MKDIVTNYRRQVIASLKGLLTLLVVFASNFYLQLSQNDFSWALATKFTFSWHTEKFFLGCLVLLSLALFICALLGSWSLGLGVFSVVIGLLGYANYLKMFYRMEPIYPDDLKMLSEFGLLKEMVGFWPFLVCLVVAALGLSLLIYALIRSVKLSKKQQLARGSLLLLMVLALSYVGGFNNPHNLLRKKFDQTALWIPYSQKMNYYNTGFVGGFLYNLKVEAMAKPAGYSAEAVKDIVARYQAPASASLANEKPNIIYIMSESFSDPLRLKGLQTDADPLRAYKELADQSYSGQMLSQNYGGGTANIEFEALTGFSMEPFNSQLTTPYTMLVSTLPQLPSLVSVLKEAAYQTTAIHPYNTSMYKRKDVYNVLGFDRFLDEKSLNYQEKIAENPYISDESAFKEIVTLLARPEPQFVHLVTMQTHMPYADKYQRSAHKIAGVENPATLDSYMQDIEYTSLALQHFFEQLKTLPRRTLVVFWGDHLPSIYDEAYQKQNSDEDLHQTEFLFLDSQEALGKQAERSEVLSPVYFAPELFQLAQLPTTGFYQLLTELKTTLPAFEKNYYFTNNRWAATRKLSDAGDKVYSDYVMIQYDIVAGEQYSLDLDFFSREVAK